MRLLRFTLPRPWLICGPFLLALGVEKAVTAGSVSAACVSLAVQLPLVVSCTALVSATPLFLSTGAFVFRLPRSTSERELAERIRCWMEGHGGPPISVFFVSPFLGDAGGTALRFGSRTLLVIDRRLLSSGDDAAGVAAHETAHLLAGHLDDPEIWRYRLRGLTAAVVGTAVGIFGALAVSSLSALAGDMVAVITLGAIPVLMLSAISRTSQQHELEADRLAAELLGDPAPLADYLARQKAAGWMLRSRFGRWIATHPLNAERLDALDLVRQQE